MVGNRSDFKRFLKHMLAEMEDGRDNTMSSHYALTEDEMNKMVGEILCDLTVCKTFSEVIDKHLKKLDNEGRLRVHAYAAALTRYENAKRRE